MNRSRTTAGLIALTFFAAAPGASAQRWERHIRGLRGGTYPVLAIAPAPRRDVYYSFLLPVVGGAGAVWRGRIDMPGVPFAQMPSFPLPAPAAGVSPANVMSLTTNRLGEPVVGLSANGRSDNTDPMLMSWSEASGRWIAAAVTPAGSHCTHNLFRIERAPNGDIWGMCQWRGAYVSTDDGRSFRYLDVDALLRASHPSYFPTRASGTDYVGALYSLTFAADGAVILGTETGGVLTSSDRGATWHPFDPDASNPASALAGVTALGNVYGLSARADGRLVVHGFPATTSPLASDPTRLYLVDRVARTVRPARGIPDYTLGGRLQIVSLPTGESFFHTNRHTVDSTGAPTYGGILRSTDGLTWSAMNTGITEAARVAGMTLWYDGNGRGAAGGFAVDGDALYTATSQGNIYRYVREGAVSDAAVVADVVVAADAVEGVDAVASIDVVTRDVMADAVDVLGERDDATPRDATVDAPADETPVDAPSVAEAETRDTTPTDGGAADVARDATDAGGATVDAASTAAVSSGCGCRSASNTSGRSSGWLLGMVAVMSLRRRRGRSTRRG